MTSISIFGNGNMATAIGGVLSAGGADVQYITHEESGSAAISGETVVLAVPYPALDSIVVDYASQLAGKTVVDITNPLDFQTFDSLVVPAGSSAAAELQAKLPSANVLKAFNTTFAGTLAAKTVGENATTVLVAGDSTSAKDALIAAVTAGGVQALDAGSLKRAHELEAVGFLQLTLAATEKISWTGGFAVVK
ncbi:NADPH-dependent F420 reductase [Changpingibacter yushuensis]|uniref:NADPH-dependent F420 reductase n=1 Tax=Changpingibacter yushuensis TaxID=2758440 RepID=UPI00165E635B|nr:NAD(P)-binding domain-containing protein [Changpingibacter yushuensis]